MSADRPQTLGESSDEAINQVLAAEQRAREAIAQARDAANARLSEARLRARRIEERADTRITKLRAACQRWAAERAGELYQQAESLRRAPAEDPARQRRLADAVARLAAELTGGEQS